MRRAFRWVARSGLVLALALAGVLTAGASPREGAREPDPPPRFERHAPPASDLFLGSRPARYVTAPASTTFLGAWDFDSMLGGDTQGWTSHDITANPEAYFHVADASELDGGTYGRLLPLRGSKSLWCGLPPDAVAFPQCSWVDPPGYGNNWMQNWATKGCIDVETDVQMTFVFSCDSERDYDATYIEVSECGHDTWDLVDGGKFVFDGVIVDSTHTTMITGFDSSSIEIRFRFSSNGSWSDEDGLYVGDGALLIDSLFISDNTGVVVPLEDFEDEAPGAQEADDWHVPAPPPFGDYAGLFWGGNVLQEDVCAMNLSCFWGFFEGSTDSYGCGGGHPEQLAVPYWKADGVCSISIDNEIRSPWILFTGTGAVSKLEFDVYRDLAFENMVFYVWHVRSLVDGCPTEWRDRGVFGYYGESKNWYQHREDIGDLIDPAASHIQIALGVVDFWYNCGPIVGGTCHTHSPLYDNVRVYREPKTGPTWYLRAIDLFQDTFPRDGSLTGTGRADMAQDPAHGYHEPEYFPGDSAVVYSVTDYNGLAVVSGPPYDHRAVYCYVSVAPPDPNKAGVNLENTNLLGGLPRFAYRGMVSAEGRQWTQMNMDRVRHRITNLPTSETRFCIDLPDNLFEAGDTIFHFFGAQNTLGEWSYWSREAGTAYAIEEAAALPLEFQILPGAGYLRGGEVLYVDGMDGLGAQPYFDTAFQQLADYGKYVDRFDVNGPSSAVSNRLGTRVYDIAQLTTPYRAIIWNTGDLPITIGDGTGNPEKSNDWLVLDAFLQGLADAEQTGILYLNGDDIPSVWAGQTGASAVAMRDWLHYSLPAGGWDHLPLVGVSPYGVGLPVVDNAYGDPLSHPNGPDTLVVFGGCPAISDFDFVTPTGAAVTQMEYRGVGDTGPASAAAIIGERHPNAGGTTNMLMSGFSFHSIRDDRPGGALDRAWHLKHSLRWSGVGPLAPPTGAGEGPQYTNNLAQNYPNPFNPTTTIAFTVKARTRVRLRIYDVTGALVRNLVDDVRAPGITHEVRWDGHNEVGEAVASGVYFYRLVAKDFTQTRKMVVLK